jgi:glycosyltransferase involved in cell wall biosynthesis
MRALSVLIPARNEQFLAKTIENVLANIEADTEIIVTLDGEWADPVIQDHERVTVLFHPKSVGQRAATNDAARLSSAKYVMKLDAHCAVGPGFDRIMIEDMQGHDDWTMVPKMYNLHAFDWVCKNCGKHRYQGRSGPCRECGGETYQDIVWRAKHNPVVTSMRFDRELHFQYWGEYKRRQHGNLVDTMSILGACWLLTRDKYWELNICDEGHGSWGQQGTEVACKTWLSGGRLVVNKRTWFAHMFRTQGGDFGFPYPLSNKDIDKARAYSRRLWEPSNPDQLPKWDKAVHPLSWLIEKFAPVPGWSPEVATPTANSGPSKGIIYYTDGEVSADIDAAVKKQLLLPGLPIVSASLTPIDFGQNVVVDGERGVLTMFKQILAALEASSAEVIFFCEHDVLYHPSHFEFTPPKSDVFFYYNENTWKVDYESGKALFYYCKQTSGLCAYRELLLEHYRKRVQLVEQSGYSSKMGFEPGTHNREERVDDTKAEAWMSEYPNIDIRHGNNLTPSRWSKDQFRNEPKGWVEADAVPGWGVTLGRFKELLRSI